MSSGQGPGVAVPRAAHWAGGPLSNDQSAPLVRAGRESRASLKSAARCPSPSVTVAVNLSTTWLSAPWTSAGVDQLVRMVSILWPPSWGGNVPEVLHHTPPDAGPMSSCQVVGPVLPRVGEGSVSAMRKGTSSETDQFAVPDGVIHCTEGGDFSTPQAAQKTEIQSSAGWMDRDI